MAENTNKLNTQLNFAIPTTQEEREKIIFLAVKILTEKEGGNITLNQLLSYVDDNLNNLSNEVAQALINKSDDGHNHDDRYYTEDEVNTKVNQLKSDLDSKANNNDVGIDLLWEKDLSSFEPQTISLDLSPYRFIDILCNFAVNLDGQCFIRRFPIGVIAQIEFTQFLYDTATDVTHALNGCYRNITITTTGITFGNGQMIYDGNVYKDWSTRCVPYKIYGVK